MRALGPMFAAICVAIAGCSSEVDRAATESIWLPADAAYPNGIATASDGTIYIGQITQGGVLQRSPGGDWSTLHPGSPDIFAGTSLRLDEDRHRLWGASPDFLPPDEPRTPNVFAIDTRTGQVLQTVPLPDGFTNDIAVEPAGSVLITDSTNGRVLRLNAGQSSFETVVHDPRLTHESGIGVGGIARADGGEMVLGNYSAGRLYIFDDDVLREMSLPRTIENPDGIAFADDGSLIVLEGAVNSGNGKVLRIREPLAPGERELLTLTEGLESPVNLSIGSDGRAYVTESRIRHRIVDDLADQPDPEEFRTVALEVT
jgi:DNA-binding beta-propeller fold protein YncE